MIVCNDPAQDYVSGRNCGRACEMYFRGHLRGRYWRIPPGTIYESSMINWPCPEVGRNVSLSIYTIKGKRSKLAMLSRKVVNETKRKIRKIKRMGLGKKCD